MLTPDAAKAHLTPGREAAELAVVIDTLLKADNGDPAVIPALQPFLGKALLENRVIEYSPEAGVDIGSNYYVLWEPFIRAKAALLVGITAEHCKGPLPRIDPVVDRLVEILREPCEEIELVFALFAFAQIVLKDKSYVTRIRDVAVAASSLTLFAAGPQKAFSLFHEGAFRSEVFKALLDIAGCALDSVPDLTALVGAQLPNALTGIGVLAPVYNQKHCDWQFKLLEVFARLITEWPNGRSLFDVDKFPRSPDAPAVARVMRWVLSAYDPGRFRNELAGIPKAGRVQRTLDQMAAKYAK